MTLLLTRTRLRWADPIVFGPPLPLQRNITSGYAWGDYRACYQCGVTWHGGPRCWNCGTTSLVTTL